MDIHINTGDDRAPDMFATNANGDYNIKVSVDEYLEALDRVTPGQATLPHMEVAPPQHLWMEMQRMRGAFMPAPPLGMRSEHLYALVERLSRKYLDLRKEVAELKREREHSTHTVRFVADYGTTDRPRTEPPAPPEHPDVVLTLSVDEDCEMAYVKDSFYGFSKGGNYWDFHHDGADHKVLRKLDFNCHESLLRALLRHHHAAGRTTKIVREKFDYLSS